MYVFSFNFCTVIYKIYIYIYTSMKYVTYRVSCIQIFVLLYYYSLQLIFEIKQLTYLFKQHPVGLS